VTLIRAMQIATMYQALLTSNGSNQALLISNGSHQIFKNNNQLPQKLPTRTTSVISSSDMAVMILHPISCKLTLIC
jgi:hypothetical protein